MTETLTKLSRAEMLARLSQRDGMFCMHPNCDRELDFSITDDNNPTFVTVDHWMPVVWCKMQGWTYEETWGLDNLKLMHKRCNARKGQVVPNDDGTIPEKKKKEFRYRRQKRAERPEICTSCNAGRGLGPNEVCASCGSGPLPERFPRWAKMRSSECDHELFWCAWCSIGVIPRTGAIEMIMLGGEGGDSDEETQDAELRYSDEFEVPTK